MSRRKKRKGHSFPILLFLCLLLFIMINIENHRDFFSPYIQKIRQALPSSIEELLPDERDPDQDVKTLSSLIDAYLPDDGESDVPDTIDGYAYYYQTLSEDEQKYYRQIYYGVTDLEESITLSSTDADQIHRVYRFVLYDHPELFWCSGSSKSSVYPRKTEFKPEYTLSAEEIQSRQTEIDSAVSACLADLDADASTYDKLRYVYKWIIDTVDYDKEASDSQNIYSSLVNHRSVCAGYSRAAQYLLKELSIPAIYVTGTLTDGGTHAWNMVRYGDNWYNMDCTFGDPVFMSESDSQVITLNYAYLCCTDKQLENSHIAEDKDILPAADSMDLDYYSLVGWYFTEDDHDALMEKVSASVKNGESSFSLQCSDSDVYQAVCDDLLNSILPEVSQTYMDMHGLSQVYYHYSHDDSMYVFLLSWD